MDINNIIAFENGELNDSDTLNLFAGLIATGLVWTLQGSYGRTARDLLEAGYITPAGEVTGLFLERES